MLVLLAAGYEPLVEEVLNQRLRQHVALANPL